MSSSFFVNNFTSTNVSNADAKDLTGVSDKLLVTSAGSLVSLSGGDGINSSGDGERITLNGLAYSSYSQGVNISGASTALFLNGSAQGFNGVNITGGADLVNIGANGTANGFVGLKITGTNTVADKIVNDGQISGSSIGFQSLDAGGNDDIINNGVISGDTAVVFDGETGEDYLDNTGLISGGFSGYALEFFGNTDTRFDTDFINNSGTISGTVSVDATMALAIDNTGVMQANVLGNALTADSSGNSLSNSGKIHGGIAMTGGGGNLWNSGSITGAITFGGWNNTFTNDGQIYGSVTSLLGCHWTNTGEIHGDVTLGKWNTLDTSRGEITGTVTAGLDDTFVFSGLFGHEEIDKFATGSASTHDTLEFSAADFDSFTAVQKAMSQVGSDVLIKLDVADTIVLDDVKTTSFVSADFKFV